MFITPSLVYDGRMQTINTSRTRTRNLDAFLKHQESVRQQMLESGVSRFGMRMVESGYLPHIIHEHENVGGVIYGYHYGTLVMMVATDYRVIYLDKRPFYFDKKEYSYDVVSGVEVSRTGIGSTVTLYTKVENIPIFTFNKTASKKFVRYVERLCMERTYERRRFDNLYGYTRT